MAGTILRAGMAEYHVSREPDTLQALGLGSCVGVAIYDTQRRIGGLAHVMLPDSSLGRKNDNPAKFADTVVPLMMEKMIGLGALRRNLIAKIAGGAQMFTMSNPDDRMAIGRRNVEAVKTALAAANIPLEAEDTGGEYGRTMIFDLKTGGVSLRTIGRGTKTL